MKSLDLVNLTSLALFDIQFSSQDHRIAANQCHQLILSIESFGIIQSNEDLAILATSVVIPSKKCIRKALQNCSETALKPLLTLNDTILKYYIIIVV